MVECLLTLKRCHEADCQSAELPRASLPHDSTLRPAPGSAGSQQHSAAGGLAAALRARHASPAADSPDINYDQVAQVCRIILVEPLAQCSMCVDALLACISWKEHAKSSAEHVTRLQIQGKANTRNICIACMSNKCCGVTEWQHAGAGGDLARRMHQCRKVFHESLHFVCPKRA